MARGRLPEKPPEKLAGHRRRPQETILDPGAPVDAPPLPRAERYSEETRAWYTKWCEAPQATQFLSTDWAFLHLLAPMVDLYFEQPSMRLFAEIRRSESLLGATVIDRKRLRWKVAGQAELPSIEAKPQTPARSRSRRDPRLQLVDGAEG